MRRPILCDTGWIVLGAEEDFNTALAISQLESREGNEYESLVSGRTEAQIESVNALADFLSDIPDVDWTNGTVSTRVLIESDSPDDVHVIYNYDGSDVVFVHYPEMKKWLRYLPNDVEDDGTGWYVLCGKNEDLTDWEYTDYGDLLTNALNDATSAVLHFSDSGYGYMRFVVFLKNLFNGVEMSDMPYIKIEHVYRDRWTIVGKDGELITGVAYDTLLEAMAIAMRLLEFCGSSSWMKYKNSIDIANNCAIAGYAIPGLAVAGVATM